MWEPRCPSNSWGSSSTEGCWDELSSRECALLVEGLCSQGPLWGGFGSDAVGSVVLWQAQSLLCYWPCMGRELQVGRGIGGIPLVMPPVPWLPGAQLHQFSRPARVLGSTWCWHTAPPGWWGARWLWTKQHSRQFAALQRLKIQMPSFLPPCPKRISDNECSISVCCSAEYLCSCEWGPAWQGSSWVWNSRCEWQLLLFCIASLLTANPTPAVCQQCRALLMLADSIHSKGWMCANTCVYGSFWM